MFYQNNNDYMRDAFYYSQPQNSTYQYNGMNNMNNMNNMNSYMPQTNFQNGMLPYQPMNSCMNNNTNVENMYPQVYRIVDPVARRVISNNTCPYYTEDNVNNMVDTVYNIVEGDVSSLSSEVQTASDDTVTQGPSRNANANANNNVRQTTSETTRTTNTVTAQTSNSSNGLLKDLIKIIIIKELLSRSNCNSCNNMNMMNSMAQNFYDPRYMGMV